MRSHLPSPLPGLRSSPSTRRDARATRTACERCSTRSAAAHGLYWALPIEAWPPVLERHAPYFTDWLDHPAYDDYWRRWSIDEDYSRLRVAGLHIGGWYDTFLPGLVKNFVQMHRQSDRKQKLVIGPWCHSDWAPVPWPGSPAGDVSAGWRAVDHWQLRWFDHFLKEDEETVIGDAVAVYVLGEGWRDFDAWPPAIAQEQRLYLHSGGSAELVAGRRRPLVRATGR